MDGQQDVSELYSLGNFAYDAWNSIDQPGYDHAGSEELYGCAHIHGSVIFRATRYEESHDSVSGPRPMSKRIAFRPPFGLGLQMGKAVASVLLLSNGIYVPTTVRSW